MTRVFISYSHASEAHKRRVGGLAKRLRQDGFDVHLDQDLPSPREGWPTWCWHQIEAADYVLMVCTEMYHQRVMHQTTGEVGTGVMWEARLIWQLLYNSRSATGKFVPVLFSGHSLQDIPLPVQGATSYNVDAKADYATLRNLFDSAAGSLLHSSSKALIPRLWT